MKYLLIQVNSFALIDCTKNDFVSLVNIDQLLIATD